MKIGDEVYIHGYVDEIRKDTIIIRNDGGYFGTVPSEVAEQEPSCRNTRQVDLISRQDAIDALDDIRYTDRQDWWAVLSTVENLPSVQPNPFCALADRECPFQGKEFAWCLTCPHISEEDRALVKKVASEPKRGKWIDKASELDAGLGRHNFVCSECAHTAWYFVGGSEDWWAIRKPKYCPNCGARMESDDE